MVRSRIEASALSPCAPHGPSGAVILARKANRRGRASSLVAREGERSNGSHRAAAGSRRVRVQRARDGIVIEEDDDLVVEEPLEIRVGRAEARSVPPRSLSVTMRTPGNDFELAAGFLYTEGIVRARDDIASIEYGRSHLHGPSENVVDVLLQPGIPFEASKLQRNFYTTSSCGVCGKASLEAVRLLGLRRAPDDRPRVHADLLPELPMRLREGQTLFAATGGLHAAGRFDPQGARLAVREDVGRHNAVDKLIGERVLADRVPLEDEILAVSGRASFEIVQKAAVAGLAFLVAVGAPSTLAVDLARDQGMTLVGFARDRGYNVYTGEGRILRSALVRSGR